MSRGDLFEHWLPVVGYEGLYEVSDLGRVRSLDRAIRKGRWRGEILKSVPNPAGYPVVTLSRDGVRRTRPVHQLVCRAFHGEPFRYRGKDGVRRYAEVRHLDGNPGNPRADNLVWSTKVENQGDRVAHGTSGRGERHGCAKLTPDQVRAIRFDPRVHRVIATEYGLNRSTVDKIQSGHLWSHI